MRKINQLLTFLLVPLFLLSCGKDDTVPNPTSNPDSSTINEILRLVNAHRKSKGLGELQLNDAINEQSKIHSSNMATGKVAFGHDGFKARTDNIRKSLNVTGGAFAENVAQGYKTPKDVVNGWLGSDGHRRNIEGDYRLTGIGVATNSKGVPFYTQIFYK